MQHERRRLRQRPSNGREVLYSDTAGDPDGARPARAMRTFTDLSYDATINHPSWCAYEPYFDNGCVNAPNGIHPDQHAIVINPGNPTQIFEGSDGGMIRTSGAFADISAQCDEPHRNGGGPLPTTSGSYVACTAAPVAGADGDRAHRQEARAAAPVHQCRAQPVQRLRGHGRHAGQRHLVEPRRLRQPDLHPGDLRRRRQRRLRRHEPGLAVQRVHRRVLRLELPRTATRRSGSSPRPRSSTAAKARPSTGRRSATRTRPPARTRSTPGRSTSGGPGRSAPATPAPSRRTRRRTSRATRRTARSS